MNPCITVPHPRRALHGPLHADQRGFVATVLVITVAALLALLAIVQISVVRRVRREAALLDARHARQWNLQGVQVLPSERTPSPARP